LINLALFSEVFDPAERVFLKPFVPAASYGVFGRGAE
jgi:hypothetical protein